MHLIGQGCHRLSEIGAQLEKPPTSLSRPLQRLVELELITREKPFGAHYKDTKRSLYRIADPFLRFYYRSVSPQRSRLQSRQIALALRSEQADFAHHVVSVWEDLVRSAIPLLEIEGRQGEMPSRWWGPGRDRKPLEIDAVAESADGSSLLFGSVKWRDDRSDAAAWDELRRQVQNFPTEGGKKTVLVLFSKFGRRTSTATLFGPQEVLAVLC